MLHSDGYDEGYFVFECVQMCIIVEVIDCGLCISMRTHLIIFLVDSLVELFLQYLLPPSRKLVPFENRPLDKLDMNKRADQTKCLIWYLEGQLKKRYLRFLENVEKLSYDKVEASKSKSVKVLYT